MTSLNNIELEREEACAIKLEEVEDGQEQEQLEEYEMREQGRIQFCRGCRVLTIGRRL